jgi:putative transcriptional regulator
VKGPRPAWVHQLHIKWGEQVRQARTLRGWSQADLARRCESSVSTISRVETGAVAAQDELKWRIAQALGLPLNELWGWPDTMPPSDNRLDEPEPVSEPVRERALEPRWRLFDDEAQPGEVTQGVLNVRQLATVLGIHTTTIYAHLSAGDFPLKPLPLPGHRRFSRLAVERFLGYDTATQETPPAPPD